MYIRMPSTGGGLKICPKSVDMMQRSALTALYVEHWWPIAANYRHRIVYKRRADAARMSAEAIHLGPKFSKSLGNFPIAGHIRMSVEG